MIYSQKSSLHSEMVNLPTLASQTFIEYIQEVLDNQSYVIGIFLDLAKAYSVLNHQFYWRN